MRKILGRGGPLAVFYEYPALISLGLICTCAETAWATLLFVLEFYVKEELFPRQAEQYVASRIAIVFLAFVGAETFLKYPMGTLADRYGPRRFVLLALSICSVTPILMLVFGTLFPTSYLPFIPLRIFDGIAAAALWPAMSALMVRAVPREAKAASMSVFNAAYCLGLAIGPTTGLLLGHLLGTNRLVFPVAALLMLIGLAIALLYIPRSADTIHMEAESLDEERRLVQGRPMLKRMMFLYALSQIGVGILAPTIVVYIESQFGLRQADLPRLLIAPALLIAAVAVPLGRLPDSIGKAKSVWISYALAAGGMLCIAGSSLFAPTEDLSSLPMTIFALGVGAMIISYILGTPAWLGLTSLQVSEKNQAQALSLMQTAQGVGVVIAFVLVGTAGYFLTTVEKLRDRLDRDTVARVAEVTRDAVPLSSWFWLATLIFTACLIGTLLWVREPEPAIEASRTDDEADKQPLTLQGF